MEPKESYTVRQVKKLYDISVVSATHMDFNNRILHYPVHERRG